MTGQTDPLCGICDQPATGPVVRIDHADPQSRHVALDHDDCYAALITARFIGETTARDLATGATS